MTTKADFNAEEWATIVEAPLMAAMQVVAAERGGTIRESLAVGRAYADARKHQGQSPLLDELVASPPALDPNTLREGGGDLKSQASGRLAQATALVTEKAAPEEAEAYRQFVLTVAEAAANANREGGFAGIGGKPVSANEQAALDEIRATLGQS
jgi:hypothetical protein